MRIKDIVEQIENKSELTNEQKEFVKQRWSRKPLIKDEKYGSKRCPNCNDVITYMNAHFCMQCGQRIVTHW